jgi:tRNA-2-methylthio-N6-dimethylallyladenosine synthase
MTKKVHVETWGCQMNVADSEKMLSLLHGMDYVLTGDEKEADLFLLNTCHIREKAKHKVISRLGMLRELKKQRPGVQIAVTGCVAQAEGAKLLKEAPQIDVLIGPGKIDELPAMIRKSAADGSAAMATGFNKPGDELQRGHHPEVVPPTLTGKNEVTRFVNIIQGCNNFCTFCIVPFTRGREISRLPEEILEESRRLVAGGAREIMLLGQNVNSYGLDLVDNEKLAAGEDGPFVELLRQVANIPGLQRLRFTTSNPHDFTRPLARLFADDPRMGRYMHLPVQSGNDRVLDVMRRKVTVDEYRERIRWLREAVPDMAISTDLIVGFPGETDAEFEDTLKLVEEVQYSFIYAFKYSPRKGTAAARMPGQLPEAVMDERLARLNALQDSITMRQTEAECGNTREILFLYESKKNPGVFYGRTEHFRLVRVESDRPLVGECLPVLITGGNKTALTGVCQPVHDRSGDN